MTIDVDLKLWPLREEMTESTDNTRIDVDLKRWTSRKEKTNSKPKPKHHIHDVMTKHALNRAKERGIRVRDIVEGRAKVEQIVTENGKFITIIPKKT